MMEIRPITAAETRWLRHVLLRPRDKPEDLVYPGDDARDSLHVGAFTEGSLVGIASVSRRPVPDGSEKRAWQIRGMATVPELRRRGCGRALVEACIAHAAQAGGRSVWCYARAAAVGFYEACGFKTRGREFQIPGIGPHFLMLIDTSKQG